MAYQKICKFCFKEFESEARGTRYCLACGDLPVKKRQQKRYKRRRQYHKTEEIQRVVSRAYHLGKQVANLFLDKQCSFLLESGEVCGCVDSLELHHKDGDPLNANLLNLRWVCLKHHREIHKSLLNINTVEVLNDLLRRLGEGEIDSHEVLWEVCSKWKKSWDQNQITNVKTEE